MDLNRKYSDHQHAVILAADAPDGMVRGRHLARAATIADEIADYQGRLGAAAARAWNAAGRKT